ncbi:TPA: primosomal protein N' [Candidatus Taylorbacteria bacterium]|nr:primosomal protein N' [Candidatus Taylorbacteria bacterium]
MKIIEVIPISRGIGRETLSYFTGEEIKPGAIVSVPLRSKTISGLVVTVRDVSDMKSAIKTAPYAIKKIDKLTHHDFLSTEFIESVVEAGRRSAATTGSILNALIPKAILEQAEKKTTLQATLADSAHLHEEFVLQAGFEERAGQYKSLIRESFARKQSVFVCTPSIQDARKIHEALSKGIENYSILLHSGMPQGALLKAWQAALENTHPLLIIGTGKFLCLPRKDINLLIIEKENAKGYKTMHRPFLDIRTFAEIFAKKSKIKIVYGDMLLRIETLWRHESGECQEIISPSYRLRMQNTNEQIVDMKPYSPSHGREFQILSDELIETIKKSIEKKERIVIFTVRRGLAPLTLCGDCGTIVECNTCHAPTSLHSNTVEGEKQFFFLCHRCGERRSAEEHCKNCDSWKLVMLGIGIQGLEKELQEKFPDTPLFKIDSDTTPTDKKVQAVIKKFMSEPGSILIGTEMMVSYLEPVEHTAVVSIDALFSLPDFRIHERLIYTLLQLRQVAQKSFILQTRAVEEKIFDHSLRSNILEFFRDEIQERQTYNYPPFSVLIKVSLHGRKDTVQTEMEKIKEFLKPYELSLFPAFVKNADGQFSMHGVMKIPRKKWIDEELLGKLRALPPQFTVAVDPESLL